MPIQVDIDEAGPQFSELVAVREKSRAEREAIVARRLSAFGMWKDIIPADFVVPPSMTNEELQERWDRKGYGPSE